ncbi:MAG: 50S ribosomal protein L24 [Clostridia bacterium]|nr:50S ribosomal protein L24 [Clostridia bacterium]
MKSLHVKKGDTVIVISGDDRKVKDKEGNKTSENTIAKVIATSPEEGKVIVEGVNVVSKHQKPRKQGETGGIIKVEGAFYASKVQLVCTNSSCEKYNKAIRAKASFKEDKNGKKIKVRVCPKCGKEI